VPLEPEEVVRKRKIETDKMHA